MLVTSSGGLWEHVHVACEVCHVGPWAGGAWLWSMRCQPSYAVIMHMLRAVLWNAGPMGAPHESENARPYKRE
jgi:hypothetical protein